MKKILSLILAMMLLMGCATVAVADEGVQFKPELASALDLSASDWYASSTTRALLTVLLLLDSQNAQSETGVRFDSDDINWELTYVGKVDDNLFACVGIGTDRFLLIGFAPSIGTALIAMQDASSQKLVIEAALENVCESYYHNSTDDLLTVMEQLQEIVNS